MGVYIRGMEMPKSCFDCPFVDFEYGDCLVDENGHGDPNEPENCPLIPVPPHGDLIERDALLRGEGRYIITFGKEGIDVSEIKDAPTIIPASEG